MYASISCCSHAMVNKFIEVSEISHSSVVLFFLFFFAF